MTRGSSLLRRTIALMVAFILMATVFERVQSAEPKKLVVFAPNTTYSVDVTERKATEYVGLVELLEPLGHVEAKPDGKNWNLDFQSGSRKAHARFRDGKKDVDLPGGKANLTSNFVMEAGRGYVPLESLQSVVSQIAGTQVQLHSAARHLYLGGVGVRFIADVRKNPSRLVVAFTAPVAPSISAEGNSLRIVFTRDPVVSSGADSLDFKDAVIQNTSFVETNPGAELIVTGSAPLVANSSENGRVLTITTAAGAQGSASSTQTQTAPSTASSTTTQAPANPSTPSSTAAQPANSAAAPPKPAYIVVIDAAHGGEDTGATLAPKLFEKDVTLALARKIAHELQNRGVQVTMLRNGDSTISPDQRASTANSAHAAVYLSVHASTIGRGVRVFTSLIPPTPIPTGKRTFIPWGAAQSQYLEKSSAVSGSIAFECTRKQINVKALQGSVSPMNNISTAAVSIEFAPNGSGVESLSANDYVQNVAVAVANGIAAMRSSEGEKKP